MDIIQSITVNGQSYYGKKAVSETEFLALKIKNWNDEQEAKRQAEIEALRAKMQKKEKKPKQVHRLTYYEPAKAAPVVKEPPQTMPDFFNDGDDGLSTLVVEVFPIPENALSALRSYLQTSLLEQADAWQAELMELYAKKINEHVLKMSEERKENIRNLEMRMIEVENACRERIETLGHLKHVYENEAQVIAFKLQNIRKDSQASITELEMFAKEFTQIMGDEMTQKMQKARSSSEIKALNNKFKSLTQVYKEKMKNLLFQAMDTFDGDRHGLACSQSPNQHRHAWELLLERGYHPDTEILALDTFKDSFKDQIQKIQVDISETSTRVSMELSLHFDDLEFLEAINRHLSTMKMRIRGKVHL